MCIYIRFFKNGDLFRLIENCLFTFFDWFKDFFLRIYGSFLYILAMSVPSVCMIERHDVTSMSFLVVFFADC